MRAGSKASASRARLGRTPSIHSVVGIDNERTVPRPSKGSALTTPPPVPSTSVALVGDDRRGAGRARRRDAG